ncbi:Lrp/AsnC family transcriptional regulator [Aneurinibacillus migulanus]|uniref:AsnC family transcriptional regulator n=1 Tax=Aneurinibacillus migulanus TaxID=47500 RepID=A0A0D1UUZ2_ANEMI|nr:Lrp/AsnC family transcriptional regulator [Aneurinibacillus migulanus]KIV50849.1 AsnC family transcriptional regulator [Aneurinibacillus migulanus]KON97048.1 AsnC family transcriptional regulator [Aneurinibacillus migulanus]MED0894244.1 Lrp/AsnC family transcriptional regulator [Aneurinibacillus migulanus]MED1616930.1 Lrp/AsnC family transcriptional regulator [Aneurinibacillus migulanus]SDJ93442.1 DNA-binding transcriptional regulator, Lrp family [Aneurinibacillus migulanus]
MVYKYSELNEMPPMEIDDIDRKIIGLLHENGRISYTDLAKEVGLSRVAVQSRVNALIESGIIERFTAVINPARVGIQISAFFNVDVEPRHLHEVAEQLAAETSVTSLYHMTGPSTLHMHGMFANMKEMEDFMQNTLYSMPGIARVESQMLIKRYKSRMGMKL